MSTLYPDLDKTNFPTSTDQRYIMIDPSTSADLSAISSYNAYIEAGNMSAALQVLNDNPRLQQMMFNADKWNRHEDMLISMERFYKSDFETYLVNIVVYKGAWNAAVSYQKYNVVYWTHNEEDECYIAIQDVPAGTLPSNQTYYVPLTLRGQQGETGTGLCWRGAWNNSVNYYSNDCVSYDNRLWAAMDDSIGQMPYEGSPHWDVALVSDNAIQVLAKILTVDGAGSGLDADLLDGQHGAYYASASALNTGLDTKADVEHTHSASDITGLDAAMSGKADKSVTRTVTIASTAWSNGIASVSVTGVTSSNNVMVDVALSGTADEQAAQLEMISEAQMRVIAQGDGVLQFRAFGDVPTADIAIKALIVG